MKIEMGLNSEIFQRIYNTRKQVSSGGWSWREPFHIFTTLLLSLLLPLSFLLLARLSAAHYLQSLFNSTSLHPHPSTSTSTTTSLFSFLFLYSNSTILYVLVSLISVAAFVHCLTAGRVTLLTETSQSPEPIFRPRLYAAWVLLSTLQICVGLGIEGSISAGIDGSGFGRGSSCLLSKALLFVGLHETMLFWTKSVVKPVVDDTVMGLMSTRSSVKGERWGERIGMAMSLGTLWWWRLRDEVDSLVGVAELMMVAGGHNHNTRSRIGVAEFVGWCLYYLTVSIGTIRALKGVIWIGMIVVLRRVEKDPSPHSHSVPPHPPFHYNF